MDHFVTFQKQKKKNKKEVNFQLFTHCSMEERSVTAALLEMRFKHALFSSTCLYFRQHKCLKVPLKIS